MSARLLVFSVAVAMALGVSPADADHNSKNGEGWAKMPNDIHNTRVETKEAKDNEAFREFVQYGEGSDSINRFADDDTAAKRAQGQKGKSSTEQTQTQTMQGTRSNERSSTQTRTRLNKASSATARQRSAMQEQRSQRPGRQADNRRRSRGGR